MVKAELFVPETPKAVRLEMDIETARWLRAKLGKMIVINDGEESKIFYKVLKELNIGE
jgi:hypothetical protein